MGNLNASQVREYIEQDLSPTLIEYQYMLSPEYTRKCSYACCKMYNSKRSKIYKKRPTFDNHVLTDDENLSQQDELNSSPSISSSISPTMNQQDQQDQLHEENNVNNLNNNNLDNNNVNNSNNNNNSNHHNIISNNSIPLSLLPDEVNVVVRVIPKQFEMGDGKSNHSIRKAIHHSLSQIYHLNQLILDDYTFYNPSHGDLDETFILFDGPFIPKHANIPLLYDVYESKNAWFIVLEMYNYTWEELIQFNKVLLETDDIRRRFLFYQLLQAVSHCHKNNIAHGKLIPNNILINEMLWISIIGQDILYTPEHISDHHHHVLQTPMAEFKSPSKTSNTGTAGNNSTLLSPQNISENRTKDLVLLWQEGKISNFDYLMKLNALAGRRLGDQQYHPVLPWIIDFESDPTDPNSRVEWRDLTKTKFRLNKGDEMLDFTYQSPDNPHHVTEPLSEITYFIYKARRVSISALRKFVRQNYEPKEYPNSIVRLYQWTPDECIPEFFTDPNMFTSIHTDMTDLVLPPWASTPEEFIQKHKAALESDYVSQNIHHWIDLIFGYKLSGHHAIEAKNVMLRKENNDLYPSRFGFVQLFFEPHPPRYSTSNSIMERMHLYENSVKFSSKYFTSSAYHVVPFIEKINRSRVQSKGELYNDDMFAVGCLLASLYTFEPLFNTRSLEKYIRETGMLNHQPEVPALKKISQPARSIVEKLIDINLSKGKKALFINQSKKYFPEYFKYCHWVLSNLYLFQSHLERYNFVLRQIKPPNNSQEFQESIMALPPDALDLVLPHILHMFFVKKMEKNSPNHFVHIQPWTYGIEILRGMVRYSREKFLSKFKECDSAKKILKLRLYQLYMENERVESILNSTSSSDNESSSPNNTIPERSDLLLLPLNLYSYSFSSLIYNVILSDVTHKPYSKASQTSSTTYSEGITNPTTKDQKRLFLEQLLPFFIEGLFTNCVKFPEISKKICATLCKLCNDFGIIVSIQYILDPLLFKLRKKIRHYQFDESIFLLLNNLSSNLGYGTIVSYYASKFFSIILQEIKTYDLTSSSITNLENLKRNATNIIDLLENILERTTNQTLVVNNILQTNQVLINNIMEATYNLAIQNDDSNNQFVYILDIFERITHFLCRLFHICDLKVRIQIFQNSKSTFRKILCSAVYLDGYFSQQLAVAPSFANLSKNPIVNSQPLASDLVDEEAIQAQTIQANSTNNEVTKKKGIRSFFERFKRGDSTASDDKNLDISTNDSPVEDESTKESNDDENCGFKNNRHFKMGCTLYRELCCVFGNSTMREAVLNSKMLEDSLTKDTVDFSENDADELKSKEPKIQYSKAKKVTSEKNSWYIHNQLSSGKIFEKSFAFNSFDRETSDVKFKGILEYELSDLKFNDLSLRCIDVCPSDERIILTGGGLLRHHSNPVVRLWNLESSSMESTYLCYQNTGTTNKQLFRSQVDKVKFISDNKFLCKDSGGNIHLFDVETTKYLYTVGAGSPSINQELNGTMNFITFETLTNNPNILVASSYSSVPNVQFYDLRQPSKSCAFEWKLFTSQSSNYVPNMMSSTSSAVIGEHNIKCISKCHPRDNFLTIGLSNGVIFLMEQHSGLILDSFCSHENGELTKILPYDGTKPGHFITCCRKTVSFDNSPSTITGPVEDAADYKNDLIRVWDTRNSVPSKCIKAFQVSNNTNQDLVSNAPIISFDFYSRPECDQLFALQPDRILYCKSSSFVSTRNVIDRLNSKSSNDFKNKQRKLSKKKREIPIDSDNREVLYCEGQAFNNISSDSNNGNYTDVKYLPLHKLLLVSTDTGKLKVYS
ncbi:hypothetical protein NAEGRDRAFT_80587 [Naegleria gruberi]|uniref:BEACH domain-containing protein n=1 Tax=Naegleria gruberi TaxID=5762 RepID=D2VMV9_NAEGR|nr:uncharacterized protein NAEGRDRAFT_80587 [Naegleria gruberi]EFC41892.1 hypothetical protein NAEGRDRAFT_80587 [Naegleria gruberi]|eukprot:XP_002674636.1 hypothetical protein NAEGRDRAFT_80587 [Naegleria gruberi strain NEG-M]